MTQAAAEMNFLNKAKWLESYGLDLYPVKVKLIILTLKLNCFELTNLKKTMENNEYLIGLTPTGISVYQNKSKMYSYFWPRISKLNYKLDKFIINVIDNSVNFLLIF